MLITEVKHIKKEKLLLHSCCAPCASSVVERLKEDFDIVCYYSNPNITTLSEFIKRRDELLKLTEHFKVGFVSDEFDDKSFFESVKGKESLGERSARCESCFLLRLERTKNKCVELGIPYFATTLTLSPLKDYIAINRIGESLSSDNAIYLSSNFKKGTGYLRSIELCKELGLYRQNYCGCVFSKAESDKRLAEKLTQKG